MRDTFMFTSSGKVDTIFVLETEEETLPAVMDHTRNERLVLKLILWLNIIIG